MLQESFKHCAEYRDYDNLSPPTPLYKRLAGIHSGWTVINDSEEPTDNLFQSLSISTRTLCHFAPPTTPSTMTPLTRDQALFAGDIGDLKGEDMLYLAGRYTSSQISDFVNKGHSGAKVTTQRSISSKIQRAKDGKAHTDAQQKSITFEQARREVVAALDATKRGNGVPLNGFLSSKKKSPRGALDIDGAQREERVEGQEREWSPTAARTKRKRAVIPLALEDEEGMEQPQDNATSATLQKKKQKRARSPTARPIYQYFPKVLRSVGFYPEPPHGVEPQSLCVQALVAQDVQDRTMKRLSVPNAAKKDRPESRKLDLVNYGCWRPG